MVDAWEGEKKRNDAYFHPDPKWSLNKSTVYFFLSWHSLSCVQDVLTLPQAICVSICRHDPKQTQPQSAVRAPNPHSPSSLPQHQPCASGITLGEEGLASSQLSSKSLADQYWYQQSNSYSISMGLLYLYLLQSYRSGSWSEPEASLPFSQGPGLSLSGNQGTGVEEHSSETDLALIWPRFGMWGEELSNTWGIRDVCPKAAMALILAKQKLPTRTDWWAVSQEGDLQACNTTKRAESISQHTLLPNQSY